LAALSASKYPGPVFEVELHAFEEGSDLIGDLDAVGGVSVVVEGLEEDEHAGDSMEALAGGNCTLPSIRDRLDASKIERRQEVGALCFTENDVTQAEANGLTRLIEERAVLVGDACNGVGFEREARNPAGQIPDLGARRGRVGCFVSRRGVATPCGHAE
jgi:hypothetical protein